MSDFLWIVATLVGTAIVIYLDDAGWDRKKPKE